MTITSRYNQGRSEKFSPIYVTPKDSCGARRCTVSGSLGQRPPQTPPPMTPSAMYSSPYLLKQFSSHPAQPCGRALRKPPQPPTHGTRRSTTKPTSNSTSGTAPLATAGARPRPLAPQTWQPPDAPRAHSVLHRLPLTTSTWRRSRPNRRTTPRRARPVRRAPTASWPARRDKSCVCVVSERIATSVASGKVG